MIQGIIALIILGLAIQHKYLSGVLILLILLSAPGISYFLVIFFYVLYQDKKLKAKIDVYFQKMKIWYASKNNLRKEIQFEIETFKVNAIAQIKLKYNHEIYFMGKNVTYDKLEKINYKRIDRLKKIISEKEELISLLEKGKTCP